MAQRTQGRICNPLCPLAISFVILFGQTAFAETDRRTAMAIENVKLARHSCGFEITRTAQGLIDNDSRQQMPPFADERAVAANLWNETWRCNPDFAGQNCMAARLQLCQRAYGEYGPDGVRMNGLIKAIIKK